MEKADQTFISSTFWTERIGPTAALATLKEFEKYKSWKLITDKGNYIRTQWQRIAKKNNLKIKILGIPSISSFLFKSNDNLKYRTLITQELLEKILATNTIYLCINMVKYINKYLKCLDKVFKLISKCEKNKLKIDDILENNISESFFQIELKMFKNKTILITGGTGSFGAACAKYLYKNHKPKK